MCGSKKSAPAPSPVPVSVAATPRNIADTSNDQQRKAAVAATTEAPSTFGAELGNSSGAPV